jgi:riboflavin kinase/FMN adenylyltransferase
VQLLRDAGADAVVVLRTSRELLSQTPRVFLERVLGEQLAAREVVEGFNFRFGRERAGTVQTIAEWCRERGVSLTIVPPVEWNGVTVSSSRVRLALEAGDVAAAADLLGRPYRLRGAVGGGAQRGQAMGFPTANIEEPLTLVPGDGVYAVHAVLGDGSRWPAAANVGPNPTFGESARKVEAHLIGFSGTLYGQQLALDFVARLRDTRKYGGVDELKSQIRADIAATGAALGL